MSRCKHCGATAIPLRKVCDYCGTPAEQGFGYPAPAGEAGASPGVAGDFERLLAHPELAGILGQGPRTMPPGKRREGPPKQLIALVVLAVIFWKSGAFETARGVTAVAPIVFLGLVVLSLLRRRSRQKAYPGTHVESLPVRIAEVEGDSHWPRQGWVNVMVRQPSGERRRLRYRASGEESWKADDMGAAHIKANVLVEFHHLPV